MCLITWKFSSRSRVAMRALYISLALTTSCLSDDLKAYVSKRDLEEFHFPLDAQNQQIWFNFYVTASENDTTRVLVNGGAKIVPSAITAVRDKKLFKRRYAIAALGYLKDRAALKVLGDILHDAGELDYFRGDALESLFLIDEEIGKAEAVKVLAEAFDIKGDSLTLRIARRIIYDPTSIQKTLPSTP